MKRSNQTHGAIVEVCEGRTLGLKTGDKAIAVIKASDVIVARP